MSNDIFKIKLDKKIDISTAFRVDDIMEKIVKSELPNNRWFFDCYIKALREKLQYDDEKTNDFLKKIPEATRGVTNEFLIVLGKAAEKEEKRVDEMRKRKRSEK